jgi:hypothetical protein
MIAALTASPHEVRAIRFDPNRHTPRRRLACRRVPRFNAAMPELARQKITLGEMRASGVRGLLVYCSDFQRSHWTAINGDGWPDEIRLSDIEPRFTCQACGRRGADVRPNFDWEKEARSRLATVRDRRGRAGRRLDAATRSK